MQIEFLEVNGEKEDTFQISPPKDHSWYDL